jgi:spermidine/putrescine transport system permease protein
VSATTLSEKDALEAGSGRATQRPGAGTRAKRWVADHVIAIIAGVVLVYLFVPVAYTFVFSFNNYTKSNISWNPVGSPTLKHWENPCGAPGVCDALVTSIKVGALATVVATALGTMIAFAIVRHRFRGQGATSALVFLPMATPEIVLGASLLTIFVQGFSKVGLTLGFATIVIAHIMFCVSFVVVTVKARLQSLDPRLEEAAMDLYANPTATFLRVTFPLVLPGIVAAALLAFSLSFDDFIITNFVSGDTTTFPKFVYVSYLRGIPAQANVIGFSMFLIAVLLVILGQVISSRRRS